MSTTALQSDTVLVNKTLSSNISALQEKLKNQKLAMDAMDTRKDVISLSAKVDLEATERRGNDSALRDKLELDTQFQKSSVCVCFIIIKVNPTSFLEGNFICAWLYCSELYIPMFRPFLFLNTLSLRALRRALSPRDLYHVVFSIIASPFLIVFNRCM